MSKTTTTISVGGKVISKESRVSTPYEIQVILHYFYSPYDFEPYTPARVVTLRKFLHEELLSYDQNRADAKYAITDRGRAFVHAIMQLEYPVAVTEWTCPNLLTNREEK